MANASGTSGTSDSRRPHRAGAFDIRVVIGVLLAIYGVVLLGMGLFGTSEEDLAKADGANVNLWSGVGLLASAAVFVLWARLRPLVVAAPREDEDGDGSEP